MKRSGRLAWAINMSRKIPDTITEEELIQVVNATNKNSHKVAYLLGFYQCLRVSEVAKLKPEDIDRQQHIIKIKEAKGNKDRHIPIIKPLKLNEQSILRALNKLPVGCGSRALQIAFKAKAKEVLGKDLHFHTLRHSGATWLLNKKKWDMRHVQIFLGHSRIQTTMIYTHVNPQDLVELEWKD